MSSPPTVVIGDHDYCDNPYRHQGAYAIRKPGQQINTNAGSASHIPQSPAYSVASPTIIPDNIKKSYEKQQLPVRSQSLAAAATVATFATSLYDRSRSQSPGQLATRHPSNGSEGSTRSEASCSTPTTPPPTGFGSVAGQSPGKFQVQTKQKGNKDLSIETAFCEEQVSLYEEEDEEEDDDEDEEDGPYTDDFDDVTYDIDEDMNLLGLTEGSTSESNTLLGVQTQPATDGLSPMAYETEEQQNAFFSHYVEEEAHDQDYSCSDEKDYPPNDTALLSYIAREMYLQILPEAVRQDGVEYHYLFTGKEAVECIVNIIQGDESTDRNRALTIGRALEHQGLFHEIQRTHRLCDAPSELYRFTKNAINTSRTWSKDNMTSLATGVFTPLTPCYSPICRVDQPCYSKSCPNTRNKKTRVTSQIRSSWHPEKSNRRTLWMQSVPSGIIASTPIEEQKRQERIYELINTEQDYARDLRYVHNYWIEPLLTRDIIQPPERRDEFVKQIFWNLTEIEVISSSLASALAERREQQEVVDTIGDILLAFVYQFTPYIAYGSHQIIGKHYFELEKRRNQKFANFVRETERRPESRRLELNGYLTRPTTRLARYNLLLHEVLRFTSKGNPDLEAIPQAMNAITEILQQVNDEAGIVEKAFTLQVLEERLIFKTASHVVDLMLSSPERQLLIQGNWRLKGNSSSDSSNVHLLLFDHYLIFAKIKRQRNDDYYKITRKPIPLDMLSLSIVESRSRLQTGASNKGVSYGLTFHHQGPGGSRPVTLYTTSSATRELWVEKIKAQQERLTERKSSIDDAALVSPSGCTSSPLKKGILSKKE